MSLAIQSMHELMRSSGLALTSSFEFEKSVWAEVLWLVVGNTHLVVICVVKNRRTQVKDM